MCLSTSLRSSERGSALLNDGPVVEYEEVSNRGKTSAENLKVQR
jgi:cold shock CspA family protein